MTKQCSCCGRFIANSKRISLHEYHCYQKRANLQVSEYDLPLDLDLADRLQEVNLGQDPPLDGLDIPDFDEEGEYIDDTGSIDNLVSPARFEFETEIRLNEQDESEGEGESWASREGSDPDLDKDPEPPSVDEDTGAERFGSMFDYNEDGTVTQLVCELVEPNFLPEPPEGTLASLDLANILDKHGCPRVMMQEIVDWCKRSQKEGCQDLGSLTRKRSAFKEKVKRRLDAAGVSVPQHYVKWATLDSAKDSGKTHTVPVVCWDFKQQLQSLLDDRTLFGNLDNLNVNRTNPFLPPGDSHHGKWFKDTMSERKITGTDGRMLVPIVLACDKTHVVENGRVTLEPLLFSTTLLTKAAREHPSAWRPLGIVPKLVDRSVAESSVISQRVAHKSISNVNYHRVLKLILASLVCLQSNLCISGRERQLRPSAPLVALDHSISLTEPDTPEYEELVAKRAAVNKQFLMENGYHFIHNLELGQYVRPTGLVCPISHVISDGEGADKFSARVRAQQGSEEDGSRISRSCTCPPDQSANPYFNCSDISYEQIREDYLELRSRLTQGEWTSLMTRESEDFKTKHGVHPVYNALWDLDFGSKPNGPYRCLKVDPMHAGESGVHEYVTQVVLGPKPDRNTRKWFIDKEAARLFYDVPRQTIRTQYPRISFVGGLTALTYMPSHEWIGLLLALVIIALVEDNLEEVLGRGLETAGEDATRDRLFTIEMLLCFHAWVASGAHDRLSDTSFFTLIDEAVKRLGLLVTSSCARSEGNGFNIQKFHDYFVHLLRDITDVGNAEEIHMGLIERLHKYYAKFPASSAQFRDQLTFLSQTAMRIDETYLLDRARYVWQTKGTAVPKESNPQSEYTLPKIVRGRFLASPNPHVKWTKGCTPSSDIHPSILYGLQELGWEAFQKDWQDGRCVELFFEAKLQGNVYRCTPEFRGLGSYYDWAYVAWDYKENDPFFIGKEASLDVWEPWCSSPINRAKEVVTESTCEEGVRVVYVPSKILCFLKHPETGNGHALIHSCQTVCQTNSLLTRNWDLMYNEDGSPHLLLVEVETISSPVYMIESCPGLHEKLPSSTRCLEILNRRDDWPQIFEKVAQKGVERFIPSLSPKRRDPLQCPPKLIFVEPVSTSRKQPTRKKPCRDKARPIKARRSVRKAGR